LATQLSRLKEFRQKLADAAQTLRDAAAQEAQARAVFPPEEDWNTVAPREKTARRVAKRLADGLRQDVDKVADRKTNDDVTAVAEAASAARTGVREQWRKAVEAARKPYEKLAGVAQKLSLPGADELAGALARLKGHGDRPAASAEKGAAVRGDLEALRKAMGSLGLEDEAVQRFLVDASEGNAQLKPLSEGRAVFDFLARHNLWNLFRVRAV
jgi:hypothetical protein